jgi:tetratricopeptide (TPR) repeat protein
MKKTLSVIFLFFLGVFILKNNAFANWVCGTFANDYDTKHFYFSQAIQKDPNYALPYRSRAWVGLHQKNYSTAAKDFDAALKLNPLDSVSWYGCAELKKALKDWDGALKDLKRALKLNPKYIWAHLSAVECFDQQGNKKATLKSRARYSHLSGN